MMFSEEFTLTGLAATGTVVSACAVLLRSTHQNLKTLDAMRREASVAVEKLRQELRNQDDTIFKNALDLTGDLAAVAAKIRAGEGNLGRLVMEEDLYIEIERALGLITLTLEEYREAAPVTTLTSVLFNAF